MVEPIDVAEGVFRKVELYPDRVRLTKKEGLLSGIAEYGEGDKEIRLEKITGIELRKPTIFTKGYIQFGQSGYEESTGRTYDAAGDENSVVFPNKTINDFQRISDKINELLNEAPANRKRQNKDTPEEILKRRFASGELSEQEFIQKMDILNQ